MTEYTADILRLFADAHAGQQDGIDYADARAAILPDVVELLAGGERDMIGEAGRLIDAVMKPERRNRRRTLCTQLHYILDSLFVSGDEGANIDPLLEVPYPLGRAKGTDKCLGYWTIRDFRDLVTEAYRNAADVTAAARELDETVQGVIEVMEAQHADMFGDLANEEDNDT